jgi:hypothetical protein
MDVIFDRIEYIDFIKRNVDTVTARLERDYPTYKRTPITMNLGDWIKSTIVTEKKDLIYSPWGLEYIEYEEIAPYILKCLNSLTKDGMVVFKVNLLTKPN